MLFLDLSNCGPSAVLRILYFLKLIFDILFIAIPIGLIILLTIDFAKMVVWSDEGKRKKAFNLAMKRIMYAVFIFFVPTIISVFCGILSEVGAKYTDCYTDLNIDAINRLAYEEKAIKEAEKAAKLALIKKQRDKEDLLKQQQQTSNNTEDFKNASGCDGIVYYDESTGIFYRPDSSTYPNGTDSCRGSAPYGYNKFFYQKLMNMVDDAKAEGYTINPSTSSDGAFRSFERQQYFYNCYNYQNCNAGNLAAKPGTSSHGWGIASDLGYGSSEAIAWAHNNASNYGLNFSISSENWHIEPSFIKIDNSVVGLCS